MAGKTSIIILVLVLCINLDNAASSQYDACRRVLLHSDFRSPCGSLSALHKRPCMVSTPADQQYLKDAKIKYFYQAPGVTGPKICAPRWNKTQSAECVSAPKVADNSVAWTWSQWSSSSEDFSRRVTLTSYDTDVQCIYVESLKVFTDCAVAKDAGLQSGVTTIAPDGVTKMDVYCDQDTAGGGWIRRISASDFFLDWVNYTAGFGDPSTNYWLGLDNIHLLTSLSYTQLKIVVEYPAGNFGYADYSSFEVGDSSTDYTLKVSGYSSLTGQPAGNSLRYHNGKKFSTRDMDNDPSRDWSCAQGHKGAWWYNHCHRSNLNGVYGYYGSKGMIWRHFSSGSSNSVVSSKMMVR